MAARCFWTKSASCRFPCNRNCSALQQGEIQRVGSDKMIKADVRVIAATNRDLEAEVQAGKFRADLFHRLCVYPLRVPPLRDRAEDIPLLAGYFCDLTRGD